MNIYVFIRQFKKIAVIIFSTFIMHVSLSQGLQKFEAFNFGIKCGLTNSNFSSEQPHNNLKQGFTIGGMASIPLSLNLNVNIDLLYFQQGGNLLQVFDVNRMAGINDFPYEIEIRDQKITYHNLELPVLLRYKIISNNYSLGLILGPSVGYNLHSGKISTVTARYPDGLGIYVTYNDEENITANIEKFHYGVTYGLGFEFPFLERSLSFDILYQMGLNRTYPGYSYLDINEVQGDLHSNTLYITLGFKILPN